MGCVGRGGSGGGVGEETESGRRGVQQAGHRARWIGRGIYRGARIGSGAEAQVGGPRDGGGDSSRRAHGVASALRQRKTFRRTDGANSWRGRRSGKLRRSVRKDERRESDRHGVEEKSRVPAVARRG